MGAAKKYNFKDEKVPKDLKEILNQHLTNTSNEITSLKKEISNITDILNDYDNNIISKIDALKKEISQGTKNITENLNQCETNTNNKITALKTETYNLKKYIKNNFFKIIISVLVINFISIPISLSIFSNNRISVKGDETSQNITKNQNNTLVWPPYTDSLRGIRQCVRSRLFEKGV